MLKAEKISKKYGSQIVLDEASFEINSPEIKALIGINGSGKSTFLKIIAGITAVNQGKVIINGKDVTSLPPEQRNVGYVPQHPALFRHLSVKENIMYGIKKEHQKSKAIYEQLIELLGLAEVLQKRPDELSGGYKSRVSLARALVPYPHLLLMDEPLSSMDVVLRKKMLPEFRKTLEQFQIPVIYVTHNPEEAALMADSFAVMANKKIHSVNSASEAFEAIHNSIA